MPGLASIAARVRQSASDSAFEARVLREAGVLAGDVIAFSPPLVIAEAEIDLLVERTARALDDTLRWTRTWR